MSNHGHEVPTPIAMKCFTPGTKIVFAVMVAGIATYIFRLLFVLQAATNLNERKRTPFQQKIPPTNYITCSNHTKIPKKQPVLPLESFLIYSSSMVG
jgi:hypothetical protein